VVGGDGVNKVPKNTYLISKEKYGDFEFRALFRLTGDHSKGLINSGIQYRSIVEGEKIMGYQAEVGKGYWEDIYDEHRRGKLAGGYLKTLKHFLNEDGWNSYIVRCVGNRHELYINGVKTVEYLEKDPEIPAKAVIGIQGDLSPTSDLREGKGGGNTKIGAGSGVRLQRSIKIIAYGHI